MVLKKIPEVTVETCTEIQKILAKANLFDNEKEVFMEMFEKIEKENPEVSQLIEHYSAGFPREKKVILAGMTLVYEVIRMQIEKEQEDKDKE